MTAISASALAIFGQCSATRRPGTADAIVLVGPWLGESGLGSNDSNWLGPPAIQSRMQARFCFLSSSAWAARLPRQPSPAVPTAAARRNVRRLTVPRGETRTDTHAWGAAVMAASLLEQELGRIHQRPEDVFERLLAVRRRREELRTHSPVLGGRLAAQHPLV